MCAWARKVSRETWSPWRFVGLGRPCQGYPLGLSIVQVTVPRTATLVPCLGAGRSACLTGAKNKDELGRIVVCIKLSRCKLRVSVWRGRIVFAIFLILGNAISDLPLQHFTCWLVPILQMPLCHRGNISPEIISMAIWRSLCKLHLAVACKIVCRNHLALTKS